MNGRLLSMTKLVLSWTAGALLLGVSLACTSNRSDPEKLEPVTSARIKALSMENGARATVVNLWATWCEPCKEEMPDLAKFQRAFKDRGVRVILVNADSESDLDAAAQFLKEAGVDFPSYRLGEPPDAMVKAFVRNWSAILPTTFVLDSTGQQRKFWVSKTTSKELEAKVGPLLSNSTNDSRKPSEPVDLRKKPSSKHVSGDTSESVIGTQQAPLATPAKK